MIARSKRSRTLEELEKDDWGEPEFGSHLVTECHRLRKVPIGDFTVENLRIMIGQNFSLEFLIPLAMEKLRKRPMVSGDLFEGDLLLNVVRSDAVQKGGDRKLRFEVAELCKRAIGQKTLDQLPPDSPLSEFQAYLNEFRR